MSLQLQCDNPACGTKFTRPEPAAGPVVCPGCGRMIVIDSGSKGQLAGAVLGEYRLVRLLAKGGMGEVYEAVQLKLDRRVAVKVLTNELAARPDFLPRFQREAKAAAAINHPNIVQVHDFGEADGRAFLVMEFIEGEDLSKRVTRDGKMELLDALQVIEEIALALQEAHTRHIIHRDVKPGNILLTTKGQVKLSDLGLARRLDEEVDLTATGIGIGSPHFMSPEQANDAHQVDHRADIYSLGITLFYLLTGNRPFSGSTTYAVVLAHANKPLPRGQDLGVPLPDNVEALIRRMAAKDPQDRYQDYAELLQDLQRVRLGEDLVPSAQAIGEETLSMDLVPSRSQLAAKPGSSVRVSPTRTAPSVGGPVVVAESRGNRKALLLGGVVVAVAVLVTAFVFLSGGRGGKAPEPPANITPPPETPASRPPPPRAQQDQGRPPLDETGAPPNPLMRRQVVATPLPDGPLDEMWNRARQYASTHPSNYLDILVHIEQLTPKAAGTRLEREIRDAGVVWAERQRAAAESVIVGFSNKMERVALEGEVLGMAPEGPRGVRVWEDFPEQLRSAEISRHVWEDVILPSFRRYLERQGGPPPGGGREGEGGGPRRGPRRQGPPGGAGPGPPPQ